MTQDRADTVAGSIRGDNQGRMRRIMHQDLVGRQHLFDSVESALVFLSPGPSGASIEETMERFENGGFRAEELGIEVDQTKKVLQLLHASREFCISDGLDSVWEGVYSVGVDAESQNLE